MTTSSNVILHVYDLSKGAARTMSKLFLGGKIEGIWHSGVVAFGYEYFYSTGIFREIPGKTPAGVPWKTIQMGQTFVTQDFFEQFLNGISPRFTAETYNLLSNNCNTFSNECTQLLTGKSIPPDILYLPDDFLSTQFGFKMKPVIDMLCQNGNPLQFSSPSQLKPFINQPYKFAPPPKIDDQPKVISQPFPFNNIFPFNSQVNQVNQFLPQPNNITPNPQPQTQTNIQHVNHISIPPPLLFGSTSSNQINILQQTKPTNIFQQPSSMQQFNNERSSTQHLERDIARMRIAPRNLLPSQTPILFASTAYLYEDLNVDRLMKRLLENADQMEKRLASESGHLIDNMGNSSLKTQFPFNQYSFPPPPVDSNFGRGQQFPFHNIQNNPFHNIQNNIQNGFLQGFQQGFLQGFQQPPHFIPPNPDNLQNNQSSQSNIGISQQNNFPFYHPNAYDPNQFMFNHLQNNQGLDSSNQFNNQKINVQSEQIKILHPGILTKEERTRINSLEVRIFLQQLVSGGVVPTIPGSTAINAQNTSASISTPNILTQNTGFNFNSIQQTNEGSESDSSDPFSSDEDDKQQKNINTNESMQQQRRSVRTRGWIYNSTSSGRGSKNSSGMIKDKNKNNNKNQNPDEDDGRNGIPKGLMSPLTRIRCTWKGPLLLPLLDMLRVLVLHPSGAEMVCRGCICSQQQEMSSYAPLSIIKLFHELAMSEEDDVLIKEIAKVEDAEWQLNNEEMGQSFCSCWMSILKQGNQNDSSKDPLNSLQKSSNQLPSDNIRLMCIRIAVNLFKTQLGSQFVSAGQHLSFFLAIAIRMINPYITIEEHKLICAQTLERIKYLSSMKNKQEKQQTKRNKQFSEMDKEDEINSSFDDEDNKDINERVIKDHLDLSGQMNMFGIQNENKSQSSSFQQQVQNHHHLPHREISQGEKFLQQGGACLIHNIALELGAHTHHIHNGEQINQENTVNGKQHSFGLSCIAVHALSQALKNEYDDIRQKQTQQFALPHGLVGRDVSAQINDDTLHTFLKALGVSCLDNCRASQEVGDAEVATLIQIRDSWHGKAEIRDLAAEICRILGV